MNNIRGRRQKEKKQTTVRIGMHAAEAKEEIMEYL